MKPPLALMNYRVVVCLGAGGVGKTSIAAALSLGEALRGRTVDVMTVDPAPRLLDALGLDSDSSEPRNVELNGVSHRAGARLRALRLDPKATFDSLVERYAPSAGAREAILQNRIYRNLSQALAGVSDYMAIEKLLELHGEPTTDLVVLDTPPARHAIDFLDAPRRILELLNSRAAVLLGASSGFLGQSLKLVDIAARGVLKAFDRLTGLRLLADIQEFVRGFEGMYQGFAERAERAQGLLRDPRCLILIVNSLRAIGLKPGGLIVNRTLPEMPSLAELSKLKIAPALKRKMRRNWEDFAALKSRESESLSALRAIMPRRAPIVVVPDLGREPARLADLAAIAHWLTGVELDDDSPPASTK